MKFSMSDGLLNVKTGLVCRVMKTLFELVLTDPNSDNPLETTGFVGVMGFTGVTGVVGVIGTAGVTVL